MLTVNIKFTPAMVTKLVGYVREGNTIRCSARLCRLEPNTVYGWLSKGRSGNPQYVEFVELVEQALADAEAMYVATIRVAAKDNWCAAAWWLERRNPDEWGKRAPQELRIAESVSEDAKERIAALYRATQKGSDDGDGTENRAKGDVH